MIRAALVFSITVATQQVSARQVSAQQVSRSASTPAERLILPAPKEERYPEGSFTLPTLVRIAVPSASPRLIEIAKQLAGTMRAVTGREVRIVTAASPGT